MFTIRRAALVAALATLGALAPAVASASSASSTPGVSAACSANDGGFAGGQNLATPALAMSVTAKPVRNSVVIVAAPSASERQCFDMRTPANPVNNDKVFRYAPGGVPSGLCVSDPSATVRSEIKLRRCNGSPFQQWTPADATETGFVVWVNNATGFALSDPDGLGAGTVLQGRAAGAGTRPSELWQFAMATTEARVTSYTICTKNGTELCGRDANDSGTTGNRINTGCHCPGSFENITILDGFSGLVNGFPKVEIEQADHPSMCYGLNASNGLVTLQPCNGGNGIFWGEQDNNTAGWSTFWSNAAPNQALASDDTNGDQLFVSTGGAPGAYEKWVLGG